MFRQHPSSTPSDTLCPSTTLFRPHRAHLAKEHLLGQAGAARLGELDERLHRLEQPHGKQPEAKPGEDALWRGGGHEQGLRGCSTCVEAAPVDRKSVV